MVRDVVKIPLSGIPNLIRLNYSVLYPRHPKSRKTAGPRLVPYRSCFVVRTPAHRKMPHGDVRRAPKVQSSLELW